MKKSGSVRVRFGSVTRGRKGESVKTCEKNGAYRVYMNGAERSVGLKVESDGILFGRLRGCECGAKQDVISGVSRRYEEVSGLA